jgi:hypothetical protein
MSAGRLGRPLAALATLLLLGAAGAPPDEAAQQVAGLFVQACIANAGSASAIADWAEHAALPTLPDAGQQAFLRGRAGRVWDATNQAGGKMVLIGLADGSCQASAPAISPIAVATALEADLDRVGVEAAAIERRDPATPSLVVRAWSARRGALAWDLVLNAAPADPSAPILLTATRVR